MFTSDVSARGVDYPDVSLVIQVYGITPSDSKHKAVLMQATKRLPTVQRKLQLVRQPAGMTNGHAASLPPLQTGPPRPSGLMPAPPAAGGHADGQGAVHPPRGPHSPRRQAGAILEGSAHKCLQCYITLHQLQPLARQRGNLPAGRSLWSHVVRILYQFLISPAHLTPRAAACCCCRPLAKSFLWQLRDPYAFS